MYNYERTPLIFDLPLPEGVDIQHPENLVVKLGTGDCFDIGELCYFDREYMHLGYKRKRSQVTRGVRLDSFMPNRREQVKRLVRAISDRAETYAHVGITVRGDLTRFLNFMSWSDANGQHSVLDSVAECRQVMQKFIAWGSQRIMYSEVQSKTVVTAEGSVKAILEEFYGMPELFRGIRFNFRNAAESNGTQPPDDDDVSKVLSLCEALFDAFSIFVLEKRDFPFSVKLPAYLPNGAKPLWVFPFIRMFAAAHRWNEEIILKGSVDYANGRLRSYEEIHSYFESIGLNSVKSKIKINLASVQKTLDIANADSVHRSRVEIAHQAKLVFLVLFIADTAMNWTQVCKLPYFDDYDIDSTERQGFRTIKSRANYKEVSFEVSISFMPRLKTYLKLRQYLEIISESERLFPNGFESKRKESLYVQGIGYNSPLNKLLLKIDPNLQSVSPMELRAAKSDWTLSNTNDISVAARVLQNDEKTVMRNYAAGTETKHYSEVSHFLNRLHDIVLEKDHVMESGIESAVGFCTEFKEPKQIMEGVVPDCKKAEGCLFCEKYRVHADETDTRKLVSCRFCLIKISPLSGSEARFGEVIVPITSRIDDILREISIRDSDMVAKIIREVEEDGELDSFWSGKLDMLMELGLVE